MSFVLSLGEKPIHVGDDLDDAMEAAMDHFNETAPTAIERISIEWNAVVWQEKTPVVWVGTTNNGWLYKIEDSKRAAALAPDSL